ncbi:LysR family transcriptional regulator [Yersinia mollaretii]|uniref:LysR family transcriptional regulator n=1 Tax=Yersinia mollaretii TaxID=33060 RepID=A0AA44I0P6_YERMO|nr:LysR family transcriptional regulator [Yersinia mollaretii]CNL04593.1 LysR family transcriptional regulator [Yersinia enterocolitica]NIL23656.1 LysR family transcriptional regulator [Yersinia mollaretii]CNJ08960.1 LysR family transcriptional regulator [Yersinia mollaretii]CNK77465.1 LysR family transcriptional regulator [Yersinia mollaretii]CQQ99493.1 LysR family transcriptional regulator [Yersinia mollaretii]
MDIRTLRYFVEVVRQQSFTRAAEKLFVTQPTISKMLRNLENELECSLLIREGRRLHLTDSGQAVYQRGLAILDQFQQLEAELEDIGSLKKGKLRLGIPPMVGTQMAVLISEFRQSYPGVELQIAEFGGLTVQQAVLSGELDLALTALPADADLPLTALPLFSHPLCVVVPRTAFWLNRTTISIPELADQSILIYNEDFALYRQLMEAFTAAGFIPKIAVRSGQWDFLAAMVQAHVGIAILPEPICQRLDKKALLWLPLAPEMPWQLGLIWRQGSYLSHSAQAWISRCREFWPNGSLVEINPAAEQQPD